ILLIVLGVLGAILGVFIIVGGLALSSFGIAAFEDRSLPAGTAGFVGGVVAFVGIFVILYSVAYIVAGIGVLRTREWGPGHGHRPGDHQRPGLAGRAVRWSRGLRARPAAAPPVRDRRARHPVAGACDGLASARRPSPPAAPSPRQLAGGARA